MQYKKLLNKSRFAQEKEKKVLLESIYWPLSNELKRLVIKQTTIQQLDAKLNYHFLTDGRLR